MTDAQINTNECGAGRVMYRDDEPWTTPCPIPPTTGLLALGDSNADDTFIPLCSYHMRLVDTELSEFQIRSRRAPVETIPLPPLPPEEARYSWPRGGDDGSADTGTRP